MRLTLNDRLNTPARPRYEYYVCATAPDGRVRRYRFAQDTKMKGSEAIYRAKRKMGVLHKDEAWSVKEVDHLC